MPQIELPATRTALHCISNYLSSATADNTSVHRQNQTLEQDSVAMLEEKARLESEANALTQHMKALMHDKFEHVPSQFDAETPIDKVLNMMQAFITQVGTTQHCNHRKVLQPIRLSPLITHISVAKNRRCTSVIRSGAAEAWWAHNPQVPGSKPGSEI